MKLISQIEGFPEKSQSLTKSGSKISGINLLDSGRVEGGGEIIRKRRRRSVSGPNGSFKIQLNGEENTNIGDRPVKPIKRRRFIGDFTLRDAGRIYLDRNVPGLDHDHDHDHVQIQDQKHIYAHGLGSGFGHENEVGHENGNSPGKQIEYITENDDNRRIIQKNGHDGVNNWNLNINKLKTFKCNDNEIQYSYPVITEITDENDSDLMNAEVVKGVVDIDMN